MHMFDLTLIQQWAAVIIAIGAAIGVLWVPVKWVVKHLSTRYNACKAFIDDIKLTSGHVRHIYPIVMKINEEMKPNGGSSLRDAINRMEYRTVVNELRLRIFTDNTEQIGFETDANGDCQWVSNSWERVFGIQANAALIRGWINGICYDDREKVVEEWDEAVKDKRKFALTYRANPDDPTWVYAEAYPLTVNGKVQGWVGYVHKVPAPANGQVG